MPFRALLHALVAAVLALVATGDATANQYQRVRDVTVSCTNSLRCDLSLNNPRVELYSLTLRRDAAPQAPVQLVLGTELRFDPQSTLEIDIDGRRIAAIPASSLSYRAAVYEYLFAGPEEIDALIAAARDGRLLRIEYKARNRSISRAEFGLGGFLDGLKFMDQAQGRQNLRDALQSRGVTLPTVERGSAREILTLDAIPAAIRDEFADVGNDCGFEPGRFEEIGGFAADIDEGLTLLALPCGPPGVYNQAYRVYAQQGEAVTPLPLPTFAADGPTFATLAWNLSWDADTATLTGLFRGRGLGDCGKWSRWRYEGNPWETENPGLVLIEERQQRECTTSGGPETWPALWPR